MEKLIYEHSQRAPDSTVVEDKILSLSYPELLAEAAHLARTLGEVASAVRLSGDTCVPIEPSLPKSRVIMLLGGIHVRRIFVDQEDTAN
ncbi:hypothetical protein PENCOP_c006G04120 [Penicillium coprophilum]|uniref:AMP-dependent synthetase/ligase domain-containing protein n=1 Tax=Penicillium coprophilum TaxID=36646 RepID=A0A1V6UNU5_9EURO|nr:hypothetical protein PENCOP_c006G04120 [Penicillium coprophilum]